MPGLILEDLTMGFGARILFAGLSVAIDAGEMLVVTGENGCGKSTLLKIVAGLMRPEHGRVQGTGTVGYAAPDMNLYSELTGDENLVFYAGLRGVDLDPAAAVRQVGLTARARREPVGTFSSGMRQRLKLAASLIGEPDLLVWDEPTLALDADGESRVDSILSQRRQCGGMVVVATNDERAAERWGRHGARVRLGGG